jgi:hypothetical protein
MPKGHDLQPLGVSNGDVVNDVDHDDENDEDHDHDGGGGGGVVVVMTPLCQAIVGAGIAGLALAADLERRGIDYVVLEKARSVAPQWPLRTPPAAPQPVVP